MSPKNYQQIWCAGVKSRKQGFLRCDFKLTFQYYFMILFVIYFLTSLFGQWKKNQGFMTKLVWLWVIQVDLWDSWQSKFFTCQHLKMQAPIVTMSDVSHLIIWRTALKWVIRWAIIFKLSCINLFAISQSHVVDFTTKNYKMRAVYTRYYSENS